MTILWAKIYHIFNNNNTVKYKFSKITNDFYCHKFATPHDLAASEKEGKTLVSVRRLE